MAINLPNMDRNALGSLKRFAAVGAVLLTLVFAGCSCTTRVDAGHVGIRVKLAGSERGVYDMPVVMGWVFYNPLTEQIIQFPTSVQNVVWTASPHEGRTDRRVDHLLVHRGREHQRRHRASRSTSIRCWRRSSTVASARTTCSSSPIGYMRNAVREAFSEVASKMPVQEIYGAGQVEDARRRDQERAATTSARTASSSISSRSTAPCACRRTSPTRSTARWRRRRTRSRARTASAR